jgi:EAL domain-containing protein (putative c-di-GMP-specific phosphodiesterase class I)/CheY-like chemotaxis protein
MAKRHILIVDDDPVFVNILSLNLQSHNYEISVAHSGEEALEKAKQKPDLILLDVVLCAMSGYEVCQRLRQDNLTHDIPIIMVTAKGTTQEKIEGLYIGADDYIIKPFDTEELLARIGAVLRRTETFEEKQENKTLAFRELKDIIQNRLVIPHFQPIFYLKSKQILGVEVLSRLPAGSYFESPEVLFDTAFHLGILFDLEMTCHKEALLKLGDRTRKNLVFFNISPYLVQDQRFRDFSSIYDFYTTSEKVVLELTERTAIKDFDTFLALLSFFKKKGFKISIDDVGSAYASLDTIVEIKPDYIKIDIRLIRDINIDGVRQNLLKAIVMFCKQSGIISIAEGIETQEELNILVDFGVDAGQGYFLGRPTPEIEKIEMSYP